MHTALNPLVISTADGSGTRLESDSFVVVVQTPDAQRLTGVAMTLPLRPNLSFPDPSFTITANDEAEMIGVLAVRDDITLFAGITQRAPERPLPPQLHDLRRLSDFLAVAAFGSAAPTA